MRYGAFIGKKEKRVRPEDDQNLGDCYMFVAIERHSKLVLNIAMGKRDQATTDIFVEGIRHATARSQFQITTDGFAPYRSAITTTLHDRLTGFAQLIKVYRAAQEGEAPVLSRRSSSRGGGPSHGQPDPERICTSIVERQNLSVRMGTRRFTRLTNAFSKKWENHWAAVACWFAFYNFCRVHKSLRMTPAMAAGISGSHLERAGIAGDRLISPLGYNAITGVLKKCPYQTRKSAGRSNPRNW